ncbi:MAG: SH3 domain-containing protein [Bacteroidales bacterium]|nr:SH3 domain-containing protein [Bacteroidales bacterium]
MNKFLKTLIIAIIMVSNQLDAQILLTTSFEIDLRTKPDLSSDVIKRLPNHKNVELIDYISESEYGSYFEVRADGLTGYIHRNFVIYDDAFYLALKVSKGNVSKIYMDNKDKIDKLNNRKKYEEELWQDPLKSYIRAYISSVLFRYNASTN